MDGLVSIGRVRGSRAAVRCHITRSPPPNAGGPAAQEHILLSLLINPRDWNILPSLGGGSTLPTSSLGAGLQLALTLMVHMLTCLLDGRLANHRLSMRGLGSTSYLYKYRIEAHLPPALLATTRAAAVAETHQMFKRQFHGSIMNGGWKESNIFSRLGTGREPLPKTSVRLTLMTQNSHSDSGRELTTVT